MGQEKANFKKCPFCGQESSGRERCPVCDTRLARPDKQKNCPLCGSLFDGPGKVCPSCGRSMA